jgi:hypothetical protein
MAMKEERNLFERIGDGVKGFCLFLAVFFAGDLLGPTINPAISELFTRISTTPTTQTQEIPKEVNQVPFVVK